MTFATKFLVVLCALAVLVSGAVPLRHWQLNAHLGKLVEQCHAESSKRIAAAKERLASGKEPQGPWNKWQLSEMVCDPTELAAASNVPGIQKDIAEAYEQSVIWDGNLLYLISLALVLIGATPHAWYFFLGRLREVAAAIRGHDDL